MKKREYSRLSSDDWGLSLAGGEVQAVIGLGDVPMTTGLPFISLSAPE